MEWLIALAAVAVLAFLFARWRGRQANLERAAEERAAAFMAETMVTAKPQADTGVMAKQRLLLEAAAKAGEAGEPAPSLELYERFLERYPDSPLAAQARAATQAVMAKQRLLLEAAAKALEAAEPALSLELYQRFLERYPDSPLAAQARAATEGQKNAATEEQKNSLDKA